jgi:hypothetical protein
MMSLARSTLEPTVLRWDMPDEALAAIPPYWPAGSTTDTFAIASSARWYRASRAARCPAMPPGLGGG